MQSVMNGTYDIDKAKQKMVKQGKTKEEIADWESLVTEITQAISTKVCVPTMRTQYMRTAFQIPFDATVRVSLDTNLCMISERGYDLENGKRWYRDAAKPIANNEIARFPHAVLEIKLEVKEGQSTPQWVEELQVRGTLFIFFFFHFRILDDASPSSIQTKPNLPKNSGMLYEVHKFSKFIHGCATLLPDDVQAVPYWVDDVSLKESIISSGAAHILAESGEGRRDGAGPGANQLYPHLLPHGTAAEHSANDEVSARTAAKKFVGDEREKLGTKYTNYGLRDFDDESDDDYEDIGCCQASGSQGCYGWAGESSAPTSIQKVEPKSFFANERTFVHWLHMGVVLSGVSSGILAFSEMGSLTAWYGLLLIPIAMFFCLYAMHTFLWRSERIRLRVPGRWDDPFGPLVLASTVAIIFTIYFFSELWNAILEFDDEF